MIYLKIYSLIIFSFIKYVFRMNYLISVISPTTPKDVHIPIPRNVNTLGDMAKGNLDYRGTKITNKQILRWENFSGIFRGPDVITRELISGRRRQKRTRRAAA